MGEGEEANEGQILTMGKVAQIRSDLNKSSYQRKPLGEQSRAIRRQALMVILGNIGVLSVGMGLGLPSVTLAQLTNPEEALHLSQSQASWFASLNALSSPLGGLLSGFMLDKFGRKCTLYVLNILGLISWALMAWAGHEHLEIAYIQLLVSRLVIGIATGLCSAPVGVYSAEICLPKIRGRMILGTSIAVAAGITAIYILGFFIRNDWQLIAFICCGYQLVALICVVPMPESPSWLVSKGRLAAARKSLNYFRGLERSAVIVHPEVAAEFAILQKSIQLGSSELKRPSFLQLLRQPEVYKPLLILMGLFAFQQLTGIFVVIVYAVQISTEAGVNIDPFMCAVLVGLARLITTCPMGVLLEKWGRRRSGLISTAGMGICMFVLAARGWTLQLLQHVPFLPVAAILLFIIFSTLGLYTLPFFMLSELFPQKVRGPASGLTVAFGMLMAFIMLKTYPTIKDAVGSEMVFLLYGITAFIGMCFIYWILPETKGRTLLEIEDKFRKKSKKVDEKVEMQEVFIEK